MRAVIIAGDGASADIHVCPHLCITHIREMSHFGTRPERGMLDLAKVAHMYARGKIGTFAQVAEWTHFHVVLEGCTFQHRGEQRTAVTDLRILDDGIWAYDTVSANLGRAMQIRARPQGGILPQGDPWLDVCIGWVDHGHACQHPLAIDALPQEGFILCQVYACVYADHFIWVCHFDAVDHVPLCHSLAHQVGQIIPTLR